MHEAVWTSFKLRAHAKMKSQHGGPLTLVGMAYLIVVMLRHVCEARHLFPWMGWGLEHSPGHYLDLCSAILAATAFALAALAIAIRFGTRARTCALAPRAIIGQTFF